MQSSNHEAKKRLLVNIGSNILVEIVNIGFQAWLTPYLIRNLGLKVYGIIPLVVSFIAYFNLFTMSISNAVTRFVAIHLNKQEFQKSNIYFNSTLSALVVICAILLIPITILSILFSKIFNVPTGFETDSGWLFLLIVSSALIMAITSPLMVSTFINHRFDLNNGVRILGRLLQIAVILLCFKYLSPLLKYVGLSYFAMSSLALVCHLILIRYLTPQLKINRKLFSWHALRKIGTMSNWIAINQIGALLYLNVGLIIINLFLGSAQCGRYAVIALWGTLLASMGGTISNIFAPIAFEYIAHNKIDILALQMQRSTKFLGLIMALPVGLMCGLSVPILKRWLGPSFVDLEPLVWLITIPWLVNIAINPIFAIYRGLNKLKIPAIITLVGGIMNVVLAILLIRYTSLGIYGVAIALVLCLSAKNLFFTPIYAAIVTGQSKITFIKGIITGLIITSILSLISLVISRMYDLASIPRLLITATIISAVYVPLCYGIIINKEDRLLLRSLIRRQKQPYGK